MTYQFRNALNNCQPRSIASMAANMLVCQEGSAMLLAMGAMLWLTLKMTTRQEKTRRQEETDKIMGL